MFAGDSRCVCEYTRLAATTHLQLGDLTDAARLADEAVRLASEEGDSSLMAQAHTKEVQLQYATEILLRTLKPTHCTLFDASKQVCHIASSLTIRLDVNPMMLMHR